MINIKNFEVEGGRIKENALFRIMVSAPKTIYIIPALLHGNFKPFFLFFSYFLCVSFDTLFDIFIPFKIYCTPKDYITSHSLTKGHFQ